MRGIVHDAMAGAREMIGQVVGDLRQEAQLSDDEVLARYEQQRGNPFAIMQFAQQKVGQGGDVLGEALRYEGEMERLWAKRVPKAQGAPGG